MKNTHGGVLLLVKLQAYTDFQSEINLNLSEPNSRNSYVVRCAIWNHLYNLKNVKNTHGRVLLLFKLQALACNFAKINTPPWVFFTFLKLYKWYQIAQRITSTLEQLFE